MAGADPVFSRLGRQPLLGDHVPVEEPLTATTLRLADGGACAVLEMSGWNAETARVEDINERYARLEATWRNIAAADRLSVSSYLCRGLAWRHDTLTPDHRLTPYGSSFAAAYGARLGRSLYENRLFVAVHLRPPVSDKPIWSRRDDSGERAVDRAHRLEDICGWLLSELSGYSPRLLGLAQRGRQVFSEAAEALAYASTGMWRPVALTTGRLGDAMFCEELAFHHETIEIRGPAHTTFAAQLSMKEYPAVTWPGMFDTLLAAPMRFTWAQHFEPLSPSAGLKLLTRKQNRMIWADDKARSQIAELDQAADDLTSGRMAMGRHHAALTLFADRSGAGRAAHRRMIDALNAGLRSVGLGSVAVDAVREVMDGIAGPASGDPLQDVVNEAWKRMSGVGPTLVRESRAMMGAWKSLLPGNSRFRARPGACSTRNFAAMAPLHGFARGAERSRWGAPIMILRNTAGEPYRFHWHDGEGDDAVGSALVTGVTGSGKTTAIGSMIAHTAGRADVIALDHKRGWHPLIGHLGGRYTVLGGGRPMFAPLKALSPTEDNLTFLFDLFRGCILQGGWRDLTPEEDRLLALGIDTVMENPPEQRGLAEVAAFLFPDVDINGAGARLRQWCWGETLGWVLDAPTCALDLSGSVVGLDTTALLENGRAAPPALLYLFRSIAQRLDGRRPLLLPVDEGWKVMEDPIFYQPLAAQFRTIRSKNGAVVFITQSPSDIRHSPVAAAVLEQCPNQMHFPNPRASEDDFVAGLKRTQGEFEALRALQKGSGRFLLCKGAESAVVEIPLRGMDQHLAVVSASEASLRVLDALPDRVKADPALLAPAFATGRAEAHTLQLADEVHP